MTPSSPEDAEVFGKGESHFGFVVRGWRVLSGLLAHVAEGALD